MKRYNNLQIIILIAFFILFADLIYVQIIKREYFNSLLEYYTVNIFEDDTFNRGSILDTNSKVIVENTPIRCLYYTGNDTFTSEIEDAIYISNIIDVSTFVDTDYLDSINSKLETDIDLEVASIYYLMNKGYFYVDKLIKEDITYDEYVELNELDNFEVRLNYRRSYPRGDTLRSILGNVSKIPLDKKDYYINKGYSIDSNVGISFLEYEYDDYLKGSGNIYKAVNNTKELIKEGDSGSDIKLTIDLDLQSEVESIIEEEILRAKKEAYTDLLNSAYVIISDPNTGAIKAISGRTLIKDKFYDTTSNIFTNPVTAGSIVKGASQAVGYIYNGLEIGEVREDRCVKLSGTNKKCSWKYLGYLDDIEAIRMSSNTYQFYTAINLLNKDYYYNMPLLLDNKIMDMYRTTFNTFGLGVKTGIDLPLESIGQVGKNDSAGLLLDFTIGQYDTYTPIQLSQYMSSLATKKRVKPHLLESVNGTEVETTILNEIDLEDKYYERILEGLKSVVKNGTGYGYIDNKYNPAGKTGTSESFVDTDSDGLIDTSTITSTFSGFAPSDDPKVVFTVVTPNVSSKNTQNISKINKRISSRVSEIYFKMYKNN